MENSLLPFRMLLMCINIKRFIMINFSWFWKEGVVNVNYSSMYVT